MKTINTCCKFQALRKSLGQNGNNQCFVLFFFTGCPKIQRNVTPLYLQNVFNITSRDKGLRNWKPLILTLQVSCRIELYNSKGFAFGDVYWGRREIIPRRV